MPASTGFVPRVAQERRSAATPAAAHLRGGDGEALPGERALRDRSTWLPGLAGSKNFESEFVLDLDAYRKRKRVGELKLPPVVHHLRLAESFQSRLEASEVPTRAALARQHGLTRARVTQLLDLLKLDARILDYVRSLPPGTPERMVTEKSLRRLVRLAPTLQIREAERTVAGFAAHSIGVRVAG